jgi:hypothetical protein
MKTNQLLIRMLLGTGLWFLSFTLLAQVPQGFNYQAVVRNASGAILPNQNVGLKLSILQGGPSGTLVYSETWTIATNVQGLVTLIIGQGTPVSGNFSKIDWTNLPLFLKTELDPAGGSNYTLSEIKPLLAVPLARAISGGKLVISGDGTQNDTIALFEVKRSDGQTVFAVYPEGIRAYVIDEQTKVAKGGFAVGGYDPVKGFTREYLRVTPDSVRIYIKNENLKGAKGGFAVGGYDPVKGSAGQYLDVSGKGEAEIINPSVSRVIWYPNKEAFLAGRVLIEHPDSIGLNSMAIGFESKAIGPWSQAMGFRCVAKGPNSTAIGIYAKALSPNTFALGDHAKAIGNDSYAFGSGASADGIGCFAFGSIGRDSIGNISTINTRAYGDHSFAFGLGSVSASLGAFSLGTNNVALGHFSLAGGFFTSAVGDFSTSLGSRTYAGQPYAFATGFLSKAEGFASIAMGMAQFTEGNNSVAIGSESRATKYGAVALGALAKAEGEHAFALGKMNEAWGNQSFSAGASSKANAVSSIAFGTEAIADGERSVVLGGIQSKATGAGSYAFGDHCNAKSFGSVVIGRYNQVNGGDNMTDWVGIDPLFVAGNGLAGAEANAMVLYKNGNMWIGGGLTQFSDARAKKNIQPIHNSLDKLAGINPVYFEFVDTNTHPGGRQIGVLAQDMQPVFPELVSKNPDGFLSVDYSRFSAVLLSAVKELKEIVDLQENRISQLEKENQELLELRTQLRDIQQAIEIQALNNK